MTDYKSQAIDCGMIALECERSGAEQLAAHERASRDAIMELMAQIKAVEACAKDTGKIADTWEYLYGEELGRRKATEIRAEKAEAEAERLKTERLKVQVDGEELTISQLYDRYVEAKARCARLEDVREIINNAADKLKGKCEILEQRLEFAVNRFRDMDEDCELCAHIKDFNGCEDMDFSCVGCGHEGCHCRDCTTTLQGRSNWEFAGWDKVMKPMREE